MEKAWQLKYSGKCDDWADFARVVLASRNVDLEAEKAKFDWGKLTPAAVGVDEKQLEKAVKKILRAENNEQEVVIFGDYDVDGNCATAIVWHGLKEIGLVATPFIPHRVRHGYGIRRQALEEIFAVSKPDLLITVDNGISAQKALAFCAQEKVPVIVTDHHLPPAAGEKLEALAVVHTTKLCGAGVAWLLVRRLWEVGGVKDWEAKAGKLLDLVCLATIADQVPLTDFNRQLVRAGIQQLRQTKRPGLVALLNISNIEQSKLTPDDIGFGLGPKINAIGRLTNTLEALRLLCTNNPKRARELAQVLTQVNGERQELTEEMFKLAVTQVDKDNLPKVILVASEKFHEGIVGLIASRLTEMYNRPTIAVSLDQEIGKASCRSIEGINITEVIRQFREDLIDLGGHEMAAGFSFKREKLTTIKKHLEKAVAGITDEQLVPHLDGDCRVALKVLHDQRLPDFLAQLEPFGTANPAVIVQVFGKVMAWRYLGAENQHLRVDLCDDEGANLTVLCWQVARKKLRVPNRGERVEVLGEVKINEFRGAKSPRLFALDFKIV